MTDSPLDVIHIRDLRLRCIIGVGSQERRDKQEVLVNIRMHADLSEPCLTDQLASSVDYSAVKKSVIALVEGSSYYLLEKLARKIADVCLADVHVRSVEVTVDKPGALRFARSVGVTIVRSRPPG